MSPFIEATTLLIGTKDLNAGSVRAASVSECLRCHFINMILKPLRQKYPDFIKHHRQHKQSALQTFNKHSLTVAARTDRSIQALSLTAMPQGGGKLKLHFA